MSWRDTLDQVGELHLTEAQKDCSLTMMGEITRETATVLRTRPPGQELTQDEFNAVRDRLIAEDPAAAEAAFGVVIAILEHQQEQQADGRAWANFFGKR